VSSIAFYISGHGFGHAVRMAEVMRALQRARPDVEIHVRSTAPAWLFPAIASYAPVALDVGVIQPDALRMDAEATLSRAATLAKDVDELLGPETAFLRQANVGLVVGDIPPPAFVAARRAGRPSVAISNFSWDWIYAPYVEQRPAYRWLIGWLREAYGQADLLLRLPFWGDLSAFPRVEDVPIIARPPTSGRGETRARLGLAERDEAVLLGFGGLGVSGLPLEPLGRLRRYRFLATEKEISVDAALPPNVRVLPLQQDNYNDLIEAADVVVGKPGFGLVAACLAQRTPLLYTDRGEFPEYAILVAGLRHYGHALHIPQDDLLAGNLAPYLAAILADKRPLPPLRVDGADVIAARLLGLLEGD
jgi:L-arabinokinase